MQHAVDPDHVVAVSTIVSRSGNSARCIGAGAPFTWGRHRSQSFVAALRRGVGLLSLGFGIIVAITTLKGPVTAITLQWLHAGWS
jgi:hypothetical protein